MIRSSFDKTDSVGVIPKLNPTVAIAEKDSNRHGMSGSSSMMLSAMAQVMPSPVYMKKIAIAVATMSGMIRRLNISGLSFREKTAAAHARSTAIVVVLIPPAVDPGLPPINIKRIIRNWLDSCMAVRSAVLKPAVLVVTDWNRATSARFPMERS